MVAFRGTEANGVRGTTSSFGTFHPGELSLGDCRRVNGRYSEVAEVAPRDEGVQEGCCAEVRLATDGRQHRSWDTISGDYGDQ